MAEHRPEVDRACDAVQAAMQVNPQSKLGTVESQLVAKYDALLHMSKVIHVQQSSAKMNMWKLTSHSVLIYFT